MGGEPARRKRTYDGSIPSFGGEVKCLCMLLSTIDFFCRYAILVSEGWSLERVNDLGRDGASVNSHIL